MTKLLKAMFSLMAVEEYPVFCSSPTYVSKLAVSALVLPSSSLESSSSSLWGEEKFISLGGLTFLAGLVVADGVVKEAFVLMGDSLRCFFFGRCDWGGWLDAKLRLFEEDFLREATLPE